MMGKLIRFRIQTIALGLVIGLWLVLNNGGQHTSVSAQSQTNPLGLEEVLSDDVCPTVQNTPKFTFAYGNITLDGNPAPAGTVVEATSPRGDTVGCFEVSTIGAYGVIYIYGEDGSVEPPIPGMKPGETITFHINGWEAEATPTLTWSNDRDFHQVTLSGVSPVILYFPLIFR